MKTFIELLVYKVINPQFRFGAFRNNTVANRDAVQKSNQRWTWV